MTLALRRALALALLLGLAPVLHGQQFRGTARIRTVAAPLGVGALVDPRVFLGIPMEEVIRLADSAPEIVVSDLVFYLNPPRLRVDVETDRLRVLIDGISGTTRLIDFSRSLYADGPRETLRDLLGPVGEPGDMFPMRPDTSPGAADVLKGGGTVSLDILLPDGPARFWYTPSSTVSPWWDLFRTLQAAGGRKFAPGDRPPAALAPVRFQGVVRNGGTEYVAWDLKDIERRSALPDTVFATPAGFRQVSWDDLTAEAEAVAGGESYAEAAVTERPTKVSCPAVPYPEPLRQAGVVGRVLAEVVLDRSGLPEPPSMRIVESPHEDLSAAVEQVVLLCRFTPARLQGRAVRVVVRIPFDFSMRR